jgi:hypothetical protein
MTLTAEDRTRLTPYFAFETSKAVPLLLPEPDGRELLAVILARLERIEAIVSPPAPASPHLTAKEAAAYLRISYSTFRKKATKIRRQPGTGRYRIEDLDEFASSLRPKRKR